MTGCVSGRTILMASELSYIWTLRRGQGENPRHHWNRVGWKRMSYGHFLRDGEVNECGLVKALCKLPTLPGSLDNLGAFQANFGQTVAEPCPSGLCGVNNVARVLGKLDYTCREGLSWLTTQIHNESRGHSWQRPLTTLHVREKPHTELSAFCIAYLPSESILLNEFLVLTFPLRPALSNQNCAAIVSWHLTNPSNSITTNKNV